jgi:hypothetical protein
MFGKTNMEVLNREEWALIIKEAKAKLKGL